MLPLLPTSTRSRTRFVHQTVQVHPASRVPRWSLLSELLLRGRRQGRIAHPTEREPDGDEADLNALLPAFGVETDAAKPRFKLK